MRRRSAPPGCHSSGRKNAGLKTASPGSPDAPHVSDPFSPEEGAKIPHDTEQGQNTSHNWCPEPYIHKNSPQTPQCCKYSPAMPDDTGTAAPYHASHAFQKAPPRHLY